MRQEHLWVSVVAAMFAMIGARGAHADAPTSASTEARGQIVALEQQRCEAIGTGDGKTLSELLDEAYVHVHGTGKVDTKAGFIANILAHPRRTERGELTVRLYGDIAVVTGEQFNYMQTDQSKAPTKTSNYVTQVLRRTGRQWRYVSFQLTPEIAP
jgi:hypothetical protein